MAQRPNAPSLVRILLQNFGMSLKSLHLLEHLNIFRFPGQGWQHVNLCLSFDFGILISTFNDSTSNSLPFTQYLLCPISNSPRDQSPQTATRCSFCYTIKTYAPSLQLCSFGPKLLPFPWQKISKFSPIFIEVYIGQFLLRDKINAFRFQ